MKAILFNGALDRRTNSTAHRITKHVTDLLIQRGISAEPFHIADSGVPLFDANLSKTPHAAEFLNHQLRQAQLHVWLTPLYHGSLTGVMKNALDWLECSARLPEPYLTGRRVGLICWADGVQAMQGINAMESVAKSLRAWTLPYAVPMQKKDLFDARGEITLAYQERFGRLVDLLVEGTPTADTLDTRDNGL